MSRSNRIPLATYGIAHLLGDTPAARTAAATTRGDAIAAVAITPGAIAVSANFCDTPTCAEIAPVARADVGFEPTSAGDSWERARMQRAKRTGTVYLPPSPVEPPCAIETANLTDKTIRFDADIARVSIGLRQSAQLRLWAVIEQNARETGFNYVSRPQLMALLERFGIKYSRRNLNRWLAAGHGIYWRLTTYGRVYLISYENLAAELVKLAYVHNLPDLVSTNAPGQSRAMYIPVASDNLLQFEAHCFAAWYASRNNPTIARYTLQRLWNRSPAAQRRMEALSGVTVITNEAETTDPASVPLDSKGSIRTDVYKTTDTGRTVYHFRLPNTFQASMIRQHNRKGAARRVAFIVRNLIDSDELTNQCGEGLHSPGELSRTGRFYCNDAKQAKRSRKRGQGGLLYIPDRPGRHTGVVWRITT